MKQKMKTFPKDMRLVDYYSCDCGGDWSPSDFIPVKAVLELLEYRKEYKSMRKMLKKKNNPTSILSNTEKKTSGGGDDTTKVRFADEDSDATQQTFGPKSPSKTIVIDDNDDSDFESPMSMTQEEEEEEEENVDEIVPLDVTPVVLMEEEEEVEEEYSDNIIIDGLILKLNLQPKKRLSRLKKRKYCDDKEDNNDDNIVEQQQQQQPPPTKKKQKLEEPCSSITVPIMDDDDTHALVESDCNSSSIIFPSNIVTLLQSSISNNSGFRIVSDWKFKQDPLYVCIHILPVYLSIYLSLYLFN